MPDFTRSFGYAIADERPDELRANGMDPEAAMMAARSAVPGFNAEHDPYLRLMNQGQQGSCQGASLSVIAQGLLFQTHAIQPRMSAQQAYLESQKLDGLYGRDRGSTLAAGARFFRETGMCLEREFPYPVPPRYSTRFPQGYDQFPRIYAHHSKPTSDFDLIWDALDTASFIHWGVSWGACFEQKVCDRYYGPVSGGHAIFGHGKTERGNMRVPNSWGSGFGVNGMVEWTPEFTKQVLRQRWTVAVIYPAADLRVDDEILNLFPVHSVPLSG